jgi:hypothetical protein
MTYPPGSYEGFPDWQSQPPGWQSQPPGWPGQPPGWPGQQPGWPGERQPDDYLTWGILTTIFCCLPLGIVSLVYANKVSGLWQTGRYAEARAASENAKKWAIISAVVAAVLAVIGVILWIALIVVAVRNAPSTVTTTYSGY